MSPRFVALFAPLAALAALTCKDATGADTRVAAAVRVSPDSVSIRVGHTLQMSAVAIDSAGDTLTLRTATWASSDTTIVVVSATGLATARHYGPVTITAMVDSVAGSAALRVLVPVAQITLSPLSATLVPGGNLKLTATLIGADGSSLSDRDIAWTANGSVTVLSEAGTIRGLAVGTGSVSASSEGVTAFASTSVTVTEPIFVRLVSGERSLHTCGLTSSGAAFCWGINGAGMLGNGTFGDSLGAGVGLDYPTGVLSYSDVITSLAMGGDFTCAVFNAPGRVHCWGAGDEYQLGNGSLEYHASPWPVLGGPSATAVVAGAENGCALGTDSLAYCWGGNNRPPTPQPIAGGRKYLALFAGNFLLCGIGTDSLTYCGNPPNSQPVSPTLKFTTLTLGFAHTCGITTDSVAYCWGFNNDGQLGDGTTTLRSAPTPVAGGLTFLGIAAGRDFTCGIVAATRIVHCWGANWTGQLGRSTPAGSTLPLPVSGNLEATQVTAGDGHACGISVLGRAYCWGNNYAGQLGDGTATTRFAPVLVAGQP